MEDENHSINQDIGNESQENDAEITRNSSKNENIFQENDSKTLSLTDLDSSIANDSFDEFQSNNSQKQHTNNTNHYQHSQKKHPNSSTNSSYGSKNSSKIYYSTSYEDENARATEKRIQREKRKQKLISDYKKYKSNPGNQELIIQTDSKRFNAKSTNGSPTSTKSDVYPRLFFNSVKPTEDSTHSPQNELAEYFKPEPKTIKQTSPHLYKSKKEIQSEHKDKNKIEKIDTRKFCFDKTSQELSKDTPSILLREKTSIEDVFEDIRARYEKERIRKEYLKRYDPDS